MELPLILAGIDPAERKQRVTETLDRLGLADRVRHRPDQLSGGQRQRVAITRATIMKPSIIAPPTFFLNSPYIVRFRYFETMSI